jgi:hypothetical protein
MNGDTRIVDENEIDPNDKHTLRLDYDDEVNLPNVELLSNKILDILTYMATDEMCEMRKTNEDGFREHMETKYTEFADRYYSVYQKLMSGEDITPLFSMLARIERVTSGRSTIEKEEEELGTELANKYVMPAINQSNKNKNNKKK